MQQHVFKRLRSILHGKVGALLVIGLLTAPLFAAGPARRARPPKFNKTVEDTFFSDATEKLSGPRPAAATTPATPLPSTPTGPAGAASSRADSDGPNWPALISAEALEDEIKAQQIALSEDLTTAVKFKERTHATAHERLSLLAALLAIDAAYGQPVRWQKEAATLRDRASRASANCRARSDAAFKDAKTFADDLQTLVRGGSVPTEQRAEDKPWNEIADRGQLMLRLKHAEQQCLGPWTANERVFASHSEQLGNEAQLVAALAQVITEPGYESADDDTYRQCARSMQDAAAQLREAAAHDDYEQARAAAGKISKSCNECHEGYRS